MFRFLHNTHRFARGKRANHSPAELVGIGVPTDWFTLLGLTPKVSIQLFKVLNHALLPTVFPSIVNDGLSHNLQLIANKENPEWFCAGAMSASCGTFTYPAPTLTPTVTPTLPPPQCLTTTFNGAQNNTVNLAPGGSLAAYTLSDQSLTWGKRSDVIARSG